MRTKGPSGITSADPAARTSSIADTAATGQAMTPERWRQIEMLFEAALERDAGDRGQFVVDACGGDSELRREVEALLLADDRKTAFIEPPTGRSMAAALAMDRDQMPPGSRVGAYEIVGVIASGGMGKVYLAKRVDQQYEKRVAIKVIKRGTDTDEVLRRFRSERQTLANLDHPYIAKLLDGGMTDDGLPYIVMEYIVGLPIDQFSDRRKDTVARRLGLFREVCSAVHHAHQNLVIHRDIKPANILVSEDGVPKLLDFGIAKVLDADGTTGSSLLTLEGARPMTPEYASPEQVRGDAVSTASDVYSLGVVLYELLTGHRPYRLGEGAVADIRRIICESVPDRPSTVITKTVEVVGGAGDHAGMVTPESVSGTREGHPRRLRRVLTGDVDTIVLTALHKDPARRYPSVQQMAEDVERHLSGRPILARRDSLTYQAAKFVGRHRALSALTATLALATAAGTVGIAWTAGEALTEATKARQIGLFVSNMLSSVHPDRAGIDVTVREVLDEAAERIGSDLAGQPEVEAEVRSTIGQAYDGLGLYESAERHLRAALDLRVALYGTADARSAMSMNVLGAVLSSCGRYTEAMDLLTEALAILGEARGAGSLEVAAVLDNQAVARRRQGHLNEAEALAREAHAIRRHLLGDDHLDTSESLTRLSAILHEKGDYLGAEETARRALAIKRSMLGEEHPQVAAAFNNLGMLLRDLGKLAEAEQMLRSAVSIRRVKLGDLHPSLAVSMTNLGLLLKERGELKEAEALLLDALRINRAVLGPNHPDLGGNLNDLAGVLRMKGDFAGAEACLREALDIARTKFGEQHRLVGTALHNLGRLFHYQNDLEKAESFYRQALEVKRAAMGRHHPEVAVTLNNLGQVLTENQNHEGARVILTEALELRRATLPEGHPALAGSLYSLAMALSRTGRPAESVPMLDECLKIWTAVEPADPFAIAMARGLLGECLTQLGRYEEAEPLLLESFESLQSERGKENKYTQIALKRLISLHERDGHEKERKRFQAMLEETLLAAGS